MHYNNGFDLVMLVNGGVGRIDLLIPRNWVKFVGFVSCWFGRFGGGTGWVSLVVGRFGRRAQGGLRTVYGQ